MTEPLENGVRMVVFLTEVDFRDDSGTSFAAAAQINSRLRSVNNQNMARKTF